MTSDRLGGLACRGEGYLSTGIHMITWDVRWLDTTKTRMYINIKID